jgi:hypothetical protein
MPIDGTQIIKQYDALKSARSGRDTIIDVLAPYTDPSRGGTRNTPTEGQSWMTEVYDSQGLFAHDLSGHYIQGQSTSPGKKWFNLKDRNDALNEDDEVKEWCEETRDRQLADIDHSNFYESEFQIIKDWYGMGCGSGLVEERKFEDYAPQEGFRGLNLGFDMAGRFVAGWDTWGKPHLHGIERIWSAQAAVERFGKDHVSDKVLKCYNENKHDQQFKFIYFISSRKGGEYGEIKKQKTKFKGCWVEYESKYVNEETGYDKIPCLVPRQNGLFGEPYGRGRGDIALNDLLTLSTGKRMSFEDWALKIRPVTMVRSQVLFGQQNLVPGSFLQANWTLGRPLSDAFFQYNGGGSPEISNINEEQLRQAIHQAYLIQQLQQLLSAEGTHQQTAYERAQMERHILRLIASIYSSFMNQFLEQFIDLHFDMMYAAGEFSPPPDIMLQEGGKIDVVFDSPLATTQVIDELQAMDEFENSMYLHGKEYFAATQTASPTFDLIDWDDWFQTKARKLKVPSGPIRSGRDIALLRQSRAEAEQKQVVNQELAGGAEALGKVAPFLKAVTETKKAA